MAQIYPPQLDRPVRFGSDLDLHDAICQKYPGAVRISLLIGILAVVPATFCADTLTAATSLPRPPRISERGCCDIDPLRTPRV